MKIVDIRATTVAAVLLLMPVILYAETGYDTWLRYAALDDAASRQYRAVVPATLAVLNDAGLEQSAQQELVRGIRGMLGRTLRTEPRLGTEGAIVLATMDELRTRAPQFALTASLEPDGYWLKT